MQREEEEEEESNEAIITDLDVLNCPICYEPLTVPVFQCNNGHVACSSCTTNIRNKCPSCALPIGNNRCRAIEKVIESAKILCPLGCNEWICYFDKEGHENSCVCLQCSCPEPGCAFSGSVDQLSSHFAILHEYSGTRFHFNECFVLVISTNGEFEIFQEELGQVFILNKRKLPSLGTILSVSCIQPSATKTKFRYELKANKFCITDLSVVKLEAVADNVARRDDNPEMSICLMVPLDFIHNGGFIVEFIIYQAHA